MNNIKRITVIAIAIIALGALGMYFVKPASAYTELAMRFLRVCRTYDHEFPPTDWTNEDLRSAALEVLNTFENEGKDSWAVGFCLVALGYVRNPEDLPRILNYEDRMPLKVLEAIKGFPAPDAVECMLRQVKAKRSTFREQAVKALEAVDFSQMEDSDQWRDRVIKELEEAKSVEKITQIAAVMDEAIKKIKESGNQTGD
jgi:hypothetical protein